VGGWRGVGNYKPSRTPGSIFVRLNLDPLVHALRPVSLAADYAKSWMTRIGVDGDACRDCRYWTNHLD